MHYKALEFVDPVPFSHTNHKKINTRKLCFKSKLQKNVPANNCHPKVSPSDTNIEDYTRKGMALWHYGATSDYTVDAYQLVC